MHLRHHPGGEGANPLQRRRGEERHPQHRGRPSGQLQPGAERGRRDDRPSRTRRPRAAPHSRTATTDQHRRATTARCWLPAAAPRRAAQQPQPQPQPTQRPAGHPAGVPAELGLQLSRAGPGEEQHGGAARQQGVTMTEKVPGRADETLVDHSDPAEQPAEENALGKGGQQRTNAEEPAPESRSKPGRCNAISSAKPRKMSAKSIRQKGSRDRAAPSRTQRETRPSAQLPPG
ncbi:MAG: hypothetical protein JWN95_4020 [Frankiales bacterium]|nr:hypothetical protein [Frankiales bacterium]